VQSVAVAPFIINYSGALFREYPGPWQVMLRQDNGVYACVAGERLSYHGLVVESTIPSLVVLMWRRLLLVEGGLCAVTLVETQPW
jgi:hypothetical protein